MTETLTYIRRSLQEVYPPEEVAGFIRLIMEDVCHLSSYQLLLDKDRQLTKAEQQRIEDIVGRLLRFEPIQYILGTANFYGLTFGVDASTLIPRPETEELVELILAESPKGALSLLDIGTGSGCIAITLAKHLPEAEVTGVDISAKALARAAANARRLEVGNVSFARVDILSSAKNTLSAFDVIVSNPPYVMEAEKKVMEKNVLVYEPAGALFVPDDDPLLFYREIARWGRDHLRKGGRLYFEINAACGNGMVELMEQEGYTEIHLIKDLSGKDRIIKAKR